MKDIIDSADNMRGNILKSAHNAGANGAHIGPSLSFVDILAVLFLKVMKFDLNCPARDRFVLSKGHGALGYYAALREANIISEEMFSTFEKNGGHFPGQPSKNIACAIEYSGGSLGLGLSYAIGLSLSKEAKEHNFNTYVLMGDGELNEGTIWESAMFAGFRHLSSITAIVDKNSMQSDGNSCDILTFDIAKMWEACGWEVVECAGHDVSALLDAFNLKTTKPKVIIASTIKGKGVSFMENKKEWHHGKLSEEQLNLAMNDITTGGC